jgi:hypothetical protein
VGEQVRDRGRVLAELELGQVLGHVVVEIELAVLVQVEQEDGDELRCEGTGTVEAVRRRGEALSGIGVSPARLVQHILTDRDDQREPGQILFLEHPGGERSSAVLERLVALGDGEGDARG